MHCRSSNSSVAQLALLSLFRDGLGMGVGGQWQKNFQEHSLGAPVRLNAARLDSLANDDSIRVPFLDKAPPAWSRKVEARGLSSLVALPPLPSS